MYLQLIDNLHMKSSVLNYANSFCGSWIQLIKLYLFLCMLTHQINIRVMVLSTRARRKEMPLAPAQLQSQSSSLASNNTPERLEEIPSKTHRLQCFQILQAPRNGKVIIIENVNVIELSVYAKRIIAIKRTYLT